jgi:hypothetical protein
MVLFYIKPGKYLLGGHFAKHNNSSAETSHFWVPAFCFQNAYVNFLKTFFLRQYLMGIRRISTWYKFNLFTVIPTGSQLVIGEKNKIFLLQLFLC